MRLHCQQGTKNYYLLHCPTISKMSFLMNSVIILSDIYTICQVWVVWLLNKIIKQLDEFIVIFLGQSNVKEIVK